MHDFKKLIIWKKGRELVKHIYEFTICLPEDEKFGLISQIRRAAISVPLNIAEGAGRASDKEFSHFLDIAYGSLCEVETCLFLCQDLDFISEPELKNYFNEIEFLEKMIYQFKAKNL